MELGLQPDIVDIWPKKLLEKATELAHKHGGEASTIMKHFIGECLESKFASIDKVSTDKLLAMLPNALPEQKMVGEFFRTAREYAQVITSGSLTKVDRRKLTLHSVKELELNVAALGPWARRSKSSLGSSWKCHGLLVELRNSLSNSWFFN